MEKTLGQLKKVDLREFWTNESYDFTRWLAREENLEKLSTELGMELELEGTEVPVGPYKADIVAHDISSNRKVVIENQLEKTDHDHLGKIITYASGLSANTIIWIAKEFTEEHRRALDILNENAGPDLQIFGLEIKLFQIDESRPAPKFEPVSIPNEYAAMAKGEEPELSETKALYLEFWRGLSDYMASAKTFLPLRKARQQHWFTITVGRSRFQVSLTASLQKNRIGCEIYMRGPDAKKAFKLLENRKAEIEKLTGPLEWQYLHEGQDCRVAVYHAGVDISDKKNWSEAFRWLKDKAETFHKSLLSRHKGFGPS